MGMTCSIEQKNQKKKKIKKPFKFVSINTIKSKYIINDIFSFLCENKKLDLIKYNNKFQKILKIDINYYK